jgi:hypothetical protein
MNAEKASPDSILCPSARADMEGSIIFGVVGGTVEEPRVGYLVESLPVSEDLLALTGPAEPTEVFRIAATCITTACQQFDGRDCRLASRAVQFLPRVVELLPACRIRPNCRWWRQEGKAACLRCPQVVTTNFHPSRQQIQFAGPQGETQPVE